MTNVVLHNQSLSAELKVFTAAAHEEAESSTFMADLMGGKLSAADFLRLQEQAWLFYSALEKAAHAVSDTDRAGRIVDTRLDRAASLERDLAYLHGTVETEHAQGWKERVKPTPATAAYVERLQQVYEDRDEARLVAHHYVRYLGDMSGGQVIATMMSRHYGIAQEGLSFYRFEEIDKLKPYKDAYRAHLDAMDFNEEERRALLEEAAHAFVLNMNVFADLERGH
ncbi:MULTISPECIES: biliverdin-producing heme oxygenase [unclassified Corynebacterium]|uniref:biliverdin-producing heme oxygenase n=1 Tax=unclassified Corynebacterium TaxID=2624378 RepID=UPI0029C9C934|nr:MULTISPECIES: biliverdin-producing heme oxygenase [unclassified Corynebacterium]WPF65503.1 biliverdin-producing heme oxygenase [Corynebacterium sp. 22KM0430]WPF67999.1 biliverdin-producing heme oxygenase [Corynebacterium sp. 21KM1197]